MKWDDGYLVVLANGRSIAKRGLREMIPINSRNQGVYGL